MEKVTGSLYVALVHYPVRNKNGETIGSAITNLDVHDIARACRTFGVERYYLVTPFEDQKRIAAEILRHWQQGYGARYNDTRRHALELVEIADDLASLYKLLRERHGGTFRVLATGAGQGAGTLGFAEIRRRRESGESVLLLFGTGWGLGEEILAGVDGSLPAIRGVGDYNHLSVRSAVSIVLDRLCVV